MWMNVNNIQVYLHYVVLQSYEENLPQMLLVDQLQLQLEVLFT